jgi:hypothetical protein
VATFKEICESVFEEANGRPVTLATTNLGKDSSGEYYITDPTERNVIRWVNELNLQRQLRYVQASFMHKRGLFISAKEGIAEYRKAAVREVDHYSFYAVQSGTTGRRPVCIRSFSDWQDEERSGESSPGAPLDLIRMPDEKWRLDETPSADYNIYGSWWIMPAKFDEPDDEPLWDSTLHDILKWEALQLFAMEFVDEANPSPLLPRIQQMLPTLEREFLRRYLPDYCSPSPML